MGVGGGLMEEEVLFGWSVDGVDEGIEGKKSVEGGLLLVLQKRIVLR